MQLPYVVMNDDVIRDRFLVDARVLAAMPQANSFRQRLLTLDQECQSCSGREDAVKQRRELMKTIRKWIAELGPTEKQLLRDIFQIPNGRVGLVAYYAGEGPTSQLKKAYF